MTLRIILIFSHKPHGFLVLSTHREAPSSAETWAKAAPQGLHPAKAPMEIKPEILPGCGSILRVFGISSAQVWAVSPAFLLWIVVRRESCADVSDEEPQEQFKGLAISLFSRIFDGVQLKTLLKSSTGSAQLWKFSEPRWKQLSADPPFPHFWLI